MKTNELFEIKGHGRAYFIDEYGILWEKINKISIEIGFLSIENEMIEEFEITYFGETFTKLVDKCDITYFNKIIEESQRRKLTTEEKTKIEKLRNSGYTYRYISEITGLAPSTCSNYITRKNE